MKISLPGSWPRVEQHNFVEMFQSFIRAIADELRRFADNNVDIRVNCKTKYVEVTSHAVAGTEFTVTHNLGSIPFMYVWNTDETGMVYDSRRADWTANEIYLKCDGTAANLRILVFG